MYHHETLCYVKWKAEGLCPHLHGEYTVPNNVGFNVKQQ